MEKSKLFRNITLLKYIGSYLLLYIVLMLGFYYMLRYQFFHRYYDELRHQTEIQIDNLGNRLNEDFVYLSQMNDSMKNNRQLMLFGYKGEEITRYHIMTELRKYDDASNMVASIVWRSNSEDIVLSTGKVVKCQDSIFRLYDNTTEYVSFDASPFWESEGGQLVFVSESGHDFLIYVPHFSSNYQNRWFYLLDDYYLQSMLSNLASFNIPAIALLDSESHVVAVSVNHKTMDISWERAALQTGFYDIDADNSLYIKTGILKDFTLAALVSGEVLTEQMNAVFVKIYLLFAVIGIAGFILVILGTSVTYAPLGKLVRRIDLGESGHRLDPISSIEQNFTRISEKSRFLENRLEKYRLAIEKSLLDSVVQLSGSEKNVDFSDIDLIFNGAQNMHLWVVRVDSREDELSGTRVRAQFLAGLGEAVSCLVLEQDSHYGVFLLNDSSMEPEGYKREKLKELLYSLHDRYGYFFNVSNSGRNFLDIPRLYEEATSIEPGREAEPVAECGAVEGNSAKLSYPNEKIAQLSEAMWDYDFAEAKTRIAELMAILDETVAVSNQAVSNFFVQCVLLDTLTAIGNMMNQQDISFDTYSDLYYNVLYMCRSCSYSEEKGKIKENLEKLLEFSEKKLNRISYEKVKAFIEESAYDPNLSIYGLAEHFQVSTPYISKFVKSEMGIGFSEYLWRLRFERAQELLQNSELSIDEISLSVGYLNVSSFRRKFKEETGSSPAKWRESGRK